MKSHARANTLQSLQPSHLKQHIQIHLVAHSVAIHHHQQVKTKTFAIKVFIQIEDIFFIFSLSHRFRLLKISPLKFSKNKKISIFL